MPAEFAIFHCIKIVKYFDICLRYSLRETPKVLKIFALEIIHLKFLRNGIINFGNFRTKSLLTLFWLTRVSW